MTTQPGFNINTSSGKAFYIRNITNTGGITFIDNWASTITGETDGIYAYLRDNASYSTNNSMIITTTGTVTGRTGVGIHAQYARSIDIHGANTVITTNQRFPPLKNM